MGTLFELSEHIAASNHNQLIVMIAVGSQAIQTNYAFAPVNPFYNCHLKTTKTSPLVDPRMFFCHVTYQ